MRKFIYFLLLLLAFDSICIHGQSAIYVNKSAMHSISQATNAEVPIFGVVKRPVSFFEKLKIGMRALKFGGGQADGRGDSRNGILSLSFIGFFLLALIAVVIITPTIPSGLATLLFILSFATSIPAIIFGARGVKRDRKRGFARAGLILGIVTLSVATLMSFFLLALTGTVGF